MLLALAALGDDLACLRELYAQTGGDGWRENAGWDGADPCRFHGVGCLAGDVVTIALHANLLRGALPACFSTSFAALEVLNLSTNALTGRYVPHPRLTALNLGRTQLDVDTAALAGLPLAELDLHLVDLAQKPFPSGLIPQLAVMDLWGCGLVATAGAYANSLLSALSIVGNDFSAVELTLGGQHLYLFASGDSNVTLRYTMRNVWNVANFAASGVDMRLVPYSPYEGFDCTNCSLREAHADLRGVGVYSARYNNIYGFGPSAAEVDAIQAGETLVYDLSGNPFFCGGGGEAFDCTYLRVCGAADGTFTFETAEYVNRLPVEDMGGELTVSYNGSALDCTFAPGEGRLVLARCGGGAYDAALVQVLYRGAVVSSADEAGRRAAARAPARAAPARAEYKVTLEVAGVSQCPYYQKFYRVMYRPFTQQYPGLSAKVRYVYVSMISPARGLAVRGYTMHGMAEAYQDMYKLCLQDLAAQDVFLAYEGCLVDRGGGDSAAYACLHEAGLYDEVRQCVGERGAELGRASADRQAYLGCDSSPQTYLDGELRELDWGEGPEPFVKILCSLDAMRDDEDCQGIE